MQLEAARFYLGLSREIVDWDDAGSVCTFFGVVTEVGEAGVDAPPRPDDTVGGLGVVGDASRPRPAHAHADVVVLASYTHNTRCK